MKNFLLLFTAVTVSLTVTKTTAQTWNQYPYEPAGTQLTFPADEGYHPSEPVEWWYTVGHVTGVNTGKDYSYMLTYFYYPQFGVDGFRIFNLSDDVTETFFAETLPVNYSTIAQDHLEIVADVITAGTESWVTKSDGNGLIPFNYHVEAEQANGSISLDYNALKRPLILDTTGFFYQGATGYTYYYSQTMINVTGSMTIDGVTEPVTGTAWIDRQWGQFNPYNGEKYEWFCVQLDNDMDLNIWNIFNTANEIPQLPSYRLSSIYVDETTDKNTHDFGFDRKAFAYTPDNMRVYPQQWHYTYDDIDLMITTVYPNSEVQLPFQFYEGTTTVEGTVGGVPVTGVGFAELLHSYTKPVVNTVIPADGQYWAPGMITWVLANPEGGRDTWYDVEFSTDNKQTYTSIASGLTATEVNWDAAGIDHGTDIWLRITAYSIDHTLTGTYESGQPFTLSGVGVNEHAAGTILSVYPNPSNNGNFVISSSDVAFSPKAVALLTIQGKQVLYKTLNKKDTASGKVELQLSGLPAGTYIAQVETESGKTAAVRLSIVE